MKKKIVKKEAGGEAEVSASVTSSETSIQETKSGQGSEQEIKASQDLSAAEAVSAQDVSAAEAAPKKKLKKKKILTTEVEPASEVAASEVVASEVVASNEKTTAGTVGGGEVAMEAKPTEKVVEKVEVTSEGQAVGTDSTALAEASKPVEVDVDGEASKEVKKKKIIKKKKVVTQPEEAVVSQEPAEVKDNVSSAASAKLEEVSTSAEALSTSKTEKVDNEVPAAAPEEVKVTNLVSEVGETSNEASTDLSTEVTKPLKDDLELSRVEDKQEVDIAQPDKPDNLGGELETSLKLNISAEVDSTAEVISNVKPLSDIDVEDKYLSRTIHALEGMDDDLGISRSKISSSYLNEGDVTSSTVLEKDESKTLRDVPDSAVSKQKSRDLELEGALLIETTRISRDPGRFLLSPTMLSMKTLVAREEKLQSDLRSIRQSYGNLDTELEYIRHELNGRREVRPFPSTTSSISAGFSSSAFKPRLVF